ncbi:MAG: hypothetical protein H0T58_00720 [Gemmatimonadales bacterium]|nr:hypothetical protein [Gemmatimonadales bacterium]
MPFKRSDLLVDRGVLLHLVAALEVGTGFRQGNQVPLRLYPFLHARHRELEVLELLEIGVEAAVAGGGRGGGIGVARGVVGLGAGGERYEEKAKQVTEAGEAPEAESHGSVW